MTYAPTKENTPLARGVDGTEITTTNDDTTTHAAAKVFSGTSNPRELRAIDGLKRRAMPREHIDRAAGCSNGPELVANLRRKGLEVPCDRVPVIDRDGFEVLRGIYYLTKKDRRKIQRWLKCRGQR